MTDDYLTGAGVLAVADSAEGLDRARRVIDALDRRLLGASSIQDALARLDETVRLGAVVVDARHDGGGALDRLLDRLDTAARDGRHGSVVTVTRELIDIAMARAPHPNVVLLCESDEAEAVAALAVALALADRHATPPIAEETSHERLRQLSEEVGRIAQTLAHLSASEEATRAPRLILGEAGEAPQPSATIIRSIIRGRRLREQFFSAELFADPAWDMLLDLMAARMDGQQVAVSSLCIAAAVPATTALRWIKTLSDQGLFVRIADPRDGRRVFIELSDAAAQGMAAYFAALGRAGTVGA